MNLMQTLTAGGETYQVYDPWAARLDDDRVGEDCWSSKNLIDRLCPAFRETGAVVSCRPLEGYPLETAVAIAPSDTGVSALTLHRRGHNLADITRLLVSNWTVDENGVYSGSPVRLYDAYHESKGGFLAGCFKENTRYTFTMEGWTTSDTTTSLIPCISYTDGTRDTLQIKGTKNTVFTLTSQPGKTVAMVYFSYSQSHTVYVKQLSVCEGAQPQFTPYREETVSVLLGKTVYGGSLDWRTGELTDEKGEVSQVECPELPGWAGVNTLWCEAGETTAAGRWDIRTLLEKLCIE